MGRNCADRAAARGVVLLLTGGQISLLSSPLQPLSPVPVCQSWARAEEDRAGEHTRSGLAPPFSLSFSVSLLYIPRFTCLCFLSSMLWQWCSMLMRQCVVQPQAVIFQVISRVMNTRLLLFHLPSRRSHFLQHREGPLAMMVILGCFSTAAMPAHQCRSQVWDPFCCCHPNQLEKLLGKVSRRV